LDGPSIPELRLNKRSLGFGEGDEGVHRRDVRSRHTQHVANLLELFDPRSGPLSML
jgi:hypothetical protein